MKRSSYEIFMVLGAIWLIVGLIIYKNMSLWPIGAIFFIVGLIGFLTKKKKESDTDKK
jgi:uncharacterized membrane protein